MFVASIPVTASTPSDLQILEFESRFFRSPGAREVAVGREFGMSLTGYAVRLLAIVRGPSREVIERHGPLLARLERTLTVGRARRAA